MSRPPMNLIFPDRTAAGISRNSDGQRVIAPTRRPDGTFRQEIKIRPGFTPQEDVSLYRNSKQVEMDQHRAKKGSVPGLNPLVQDALKGISGGAAGGSKSAKKNAKRKEKRQETESVKDSWDDEEEAGGNAGEEKEDKTQKSTSTSSAPTDSTAAGTTAEADATTTTEDPAKRLRNLRKKLKQTQQLKEKLDGGASLGPAEQDKVDGMKSLEEEIATLELA
ncbi:mago-binding domain-containing protein [Sporobolomyces salmoneus]|uniref:mago-binding domain-containing protein n=1 Tax=Sporobolomyces salmoneus TaxID=183962 RepID=UPI003170AB5B